MAEVNTTEDERDWAGKMRLRRMEEAGNGANKAGQTVKSAGEGIGIAARLRAGKAADAMLKKVMPTPMKIGVKAGEMVGIDAMKWLKRAIIFSFIGYWLLYLCAAILIAGFLFVAMETIMEDPWEILKTVAAGAWHMIKGWLF